MGWIVNNPVPYKYTHTESPKVAGESMTQHSQQSPNAHQPWTVTVRIGIEVANRTAALEKAANAFAEIDIPLKWEPSLSPHGIDRWVVTGELDLSHLPVIDPDNAETRLSYVASRFPEEVLWSSRVSDDGGSFEWPPNFWDRRSADDDYLLDPAIRAVLIRVANQK